jgi:uncharacterized membrane protein YphA (DoxX/SURF4 family)
LLKKTIPTNAPGWVILIRLAVGAVFVSEGIQKFLFPAALGVGRFTKIGIPAPGIMAPFVGVVEIGCGALLILGLLTRLGRLTTAADLARLATWPAPRHPPSPPKSRPWLTMAARP